MFQLVGVDVYLQSEKIPDAPREQGSLKLVFISNRGMRVFPGPPPETEMTDLMQCRYEGENVSEADVEALLQTLARNNFEWVKVQKLFAKEGEKLYSQPY